MTTLLMFTTSGAWLAAGWCRHVESAGKQLGLTTTWKVRVESAGKFNNGRMRGKSKKGLAAREIRQVRVRAASQCPFCSGQREVGHLEGMIQVDEKTT